MKSAWLTQIRSNSFKFAKSLIQKGSAGGQQIQIRQIRSNLPLRAQIQMGIGR